MTHDLTSKRFVDTARAAPHGDVSRTGDNGRNVHSRQFGRWARHTACLLTLALLSACASKLSGYGVGPQAERQADIDQATRDPAPDAASTYLNLIERMQTQGLYYASLAHIDAFEKQYGVKPETTLMRADALRMTEQPQAAADAYTKLLQTPLAARGQSLPTHQRSIPGDFGHAAQQLQEAVRLAPTDAPTLSDLGYARLREGDVNGARVPLMKAAELDHANPKIVSNVVLFLLADGNDTQAAALMDQEKFSPDVRLAIRREAAKVAMATQAAQAQAKVALAQQTARPAPVVGVQGVEPAPRLLQRFSQ
jgi:Flp pilus assembly protein TadD